MKNAITDISGILVGHAQDEIALTGCTVILCPDGAVGGVDQRGGAPGTRQIDALYPMHLVQKVHAIVLTGGSAFGLDSASGVVKYLEERKVGFDVRVAVVPIVPTAVLFDLNLGRSDVRPDAAMGYSACQNASDAAPVQGNIGAGCGATVGKILGIEWATKSGIGNASISLGDGIFVGAIVAVNAFGDIIDPSSGRIIAGARKDVSLAKPSKGKTPFMNTLKAMKDRLTQPDIRYGKEDENTVIGVVATNASLNKEQANKVAQMAHDGLARTVRPAHTMVDGDTIFALATGDRKVDVNIIGAFAAEAFAKAVLAAVWAAGPAGGLPSASEIRDSS